MDPADGIYKSQFGEDRRLAEHFGGRRHGFFVEVGAFNGVDMSNTYYFEQLGWSGILVEADPRLAARCVAARPGSKVVHCAVVAPGGPPEVTFNIYEGAEALSTLSAGESHQVERGGQQVRRETVPARTLDAVLTENAAPAIDFMTIDVEGHEWEALQGLDLARWRPEILILERNSVFPHPAIPGFLARNGYCYRVTTGVNDWFYRSTHSAGQSLGYRIWMLTQFYLVQPTSPAYFTLKHWVKQGLRRMGVLRGS